MNMWNLLAIFLQVCNLVYANHPDCGKDPEGRKEFSQVAGTKTSVLQHPWAMLIMKYYDYGKENAKVHCSGSVVTPKFGLSAGHCFSRKSPDFVSTDEMSLFFGVADVKQLTGTLPFKVFKIQKRGIKKISTHPGYEYPKAYMDVSIIEFDTPLEITSTTYPVCLPESILDPEHLAGKPAIVIGYGPHNEGTSLNKATQNVYHEQHCSDQYSPEDASTDNADLIRTELPKGFDSTLICSGDRRATSAGTCPGDSGGPLLVDEYMNGEFKTVQNGVLHGSLQSCSNQEYPAIFSRLSNPDIHKWLFSKVFGVSASDSDGNCKQFNVTGDIRNACTGTYKLSEKKVSRSQNYSVYEKFISTSVSCGKQNGSWSEANSCEECPQGNGASWCGGSCQWTDEKCIDKENAYSYCRYIYHNPGEEGWRISSIGYMSGESEGGAYYKSYITKNNFWTENTAWKDVNGVPKVWVECDTE